MTVKEFLAELQLNQPLRIDYAETELKEALESGDHARIRKATAGHKAEREKQEQMRIIFTRMIESMKSPNDYYILKWRYLDGLKWSEIKRKIPERLNMRNLLKRHRRAVGHLEELFPNVKI